MAGDRLGTARAGLGADRLGQDARGVPGGAGQARRRGRVRPGHARPVRLAAEGTGLRHRAQPARAAARDRRGARHGRDPHRRHAAEGARGDGAAAPGRPRHDTRVAVPDPHLAGARDARRRAHRDRGRDPRGRALQARRASRAEPRAPGVARAGERRGRAALEGARVPAHRPLRDAEPAGGDRPLPRRPGSRGDDRRRRRAQAAGPAHRGAGRVDDRAGGPAARGPARSGA